jgi:outer membrane protein assembly factor BamD
LIFQILRYSIRSRAAALAASLGLSLGAGCASAPPLEEIPSAEVYYQQGLEVLEGRRVLLFFSDVDYPKAIELFQEVIDNYPYSEYATLAELKIADVYYEQKKYEEASGYYQDFVELHPTHPQVDYAIYRNGICWFDRLRDPDRDQTPTREAIAQFKALLDRFPDSQYAPDASRMVGEGEERLASHDVKVGDFYMRREQCYAASLRYEQALTSYPRSSNRVDTLLRMARAQRCLSRLEEAVSLYRQVIAEAGDGELAVQAREELEELGVAANGATPH